MSKVYVALLNPVFVKLSVVHPIWVEAMLQFRLRLYAIVRELQAWDCEFP